MIVTKFQHLTLEAFGNGKFFRRVQSCFSTRKFVTPDLRLIGKDKSTKKGRRMPEGSGKLVRLYHETVFPLPIISNQEGKIYTIGRQFRDVGDRMELIICTSEFVSRHHCDIVYRSGAFWIKDNQSLNGTFLNGTKIAPRVDRELRFGDIIGLGVSHTATDVDVQSRDYFLFRFQEAAVPIIDLGDEDDEDMVALNDASLHSARVSEKRVGPSPQVAIVEPQRPQVKVHIPPQTPDSSSDVEIIDEEPVPDKPIIKTSPKKQIPPPPPPPILSKKKQTGPRIGPASFKRRIEEREKKKQSNSQPRDDAVSNISTDSHKPPSSSVSFSTSRQEKDSKTISSTKQKTNDNQFDAQISQKSERSKKSVQDSNASKKTFKRVKLIDSSSDDDSSDGIPHNDGKFVPNIDFNPEEDESKESMEKTTDLKPEVDHHRISETSAPKDESESPSKTLDIQFLKDEILRGRRIAHLILRKIITEKGGIIQMRKKYTSKLSQEELEKILHQYHQSKRRKSQGRSESEGLDDTDSDSDSDNIFQKVVISKKRRQVIKEEKYKLRHEEEEPFSSDVSSDMESSDKDSKPAKKKRKAPVDHRTLEAPNSKRRKQEESKHKVIEKNKEVKKKKSEKSETSSKKISPKNDFSPSNVESEPRPGCSKDLYPSTAFKRKESHGSVSEENLMEYSDGDGYRSEEENNAQADDHCADVIEGANMPDKSGRRQLKMIDHAPVPRQFRKLHEKSKAENRSSPPEKSLKHGKSSPPYKLPIFQTEDAKKARQEKLQQIEVKKKAADAPNKTSTAPKSAPAPVKAKIQSRNRNQEFIDDFLSHAINDPKEKELEDSNPPKEPAKEIPAPKRQIPLPVVSPSKMPVSSITRDMERSKIDHENRTRRVPPAGPAAVPPMASRQPWPNRNLMEKEGSTLARAANPVETSHKTIINYYHGQAEPVISVPPVKAPQHEFCALPEDEAFLVISRWNPTWLHEEQNSASMPPLLSDVANSSLTRTLFNYDNFKSYMDVMFPLLMVEIWATIATEYFGTRKGDIPSHLSSPDEINEHSFMIEKISKEDFCPMISSRVPCKDHNWTVLSCYALEPPGKRFGTKKDLVIVKLNVETPNKAAPVEIKEKEYFGWITYASQATEAIKGKVNEELKRQTPNANKRFNFKIVISATQTILTDKVGHVKRVCYISPKLRDYKAMYYLKVSKLYPKIIDLQPPGHFFDPKARVPPHYLIPHVSKLNPMQKSIVAYVSERVASPSPELMLLHGAPGVGKSRTIVALILQILSKIGSQQNPKKILVCTPSNTAIDELMRRIDEAIPELPNGKSIKMVRIGEAVGLCQKLKKYVVDNIARQRVEVSSTSANILKEIDQAVREIEDKKLEIEVLMKNKGSKTTIESSKRELKEVQRRRDELQKDWTATKKSVKDGEFNKAKAKVIQEAHIVCSTLTSCSSSMLSKEYGFSRGASVKSFTCCIIDEATQATEPETLHPLLLQVDKLVLVGDPCQLGATVLSKHAAEKGYELSLFSRLHHYYTVQKKIPNSVMMLTQQYRMHPEILAWPNDAFYKGSLKTNILGRSPDDTCPLTPYIFLNLSGRESKVDGKISNELEVKLVLEVVRNIHLTTTTISSSDRRWSIGIITPYRDQKSKIKEAIKREMKAVADQVEVDTVDSFQGREKDVIIISCVRTDTTGFLNSKLRLNVALTRAKYSLIVIGDAQCLQTESMWNDLIDNARTRGRFCDIQESSIKNSKYLGKRLFGALSPTKSVVNNGI